MLVHHLPIAGASASGLGALIAVAPSHTTVALRQLTSPTGDIALALLGLTLLIGPANLVLRRRMPVNSYLRRDVGTWAAIWSVAHVIVGFQGHGTGAFAFAGYFVADGRPLTTDIGWANWTGLAATVLVVLLLVISTDRYLRELKAPRWKDIQRLNYTLFALVVLHAILYGALQRTTTSPFRLVVAGAVLTVVAGQATGAWLWRRRSRSYGGPRSIDLRSAGQSSSSNA